MKTWHRVELADARDMAPVPDASIHLVVTSPPYPMIEMWDEGFAAADEGIGTALTAEDGPRAFALMHGLLEGVWRECHRVLVPGGIACVNIGDATRKIGGSFRLFSNHARILVAMCDLGFSALPDILWRKPTNAPNKFLGSGMLPAGAYVTYEHEYILIFRKGAPRRFPAPEQKAQRRRSAFFWEERNVWFSDVWMGLRGANQALSDPEARARSGAFPFELAYRLIQMYSLIGDSVLDPFLGTGTTSAAALASGRHSIGFEHDPSLLPATHAALQSAVAAGRERARDRLRAHVAFVAAREAEGKPLRHANRHHGFPVITSQETELVLLAPSAVMRDGDATWVATCAPARLPPAAVQGELDFENA